MRGLISRAAVVAITNTIPCTVVLVVIVGKLVWAIGAARRDRFGPVRIRQTRRAFAELDAQVFGPGTRPAPAIAASPR